MPTTAPNWLTSPEQKWMDCSVEGYQEPGEYAVQIKLNGLDVAVLVPKDSVKPPATFPNVGRVRVVVIAYLHGDHVLAELPSTPVNWTRRITVQTERLLD